MKIQLIDECREWWRLWSVRLAFVAATVAAVVTAQPALLLGLVDRLPEPWRTMIVPVVWVVCFALPVFARLAQQPKLKGGKTDAE